MIEEQIVIQFANEIHLVSGQSSVRKVKVDSNDGNIT